MKWKIGRPQKTVYPKIEYFQLPYGRYSCMLTTLYLSYWTEMVPWATTGNIMTATVGWVTSTDMMLNIQMSAEGGHTLEGVQEGISDYASWYLLWIMGNGRTLYETRMVYRVLHDYHTWCAGWTGEEKFFTFLVISSYKCSLWVLYIWYTHLNYLGNTDEIIIIEWL